MKKLENKFTEVLEESKESIFRVCSVYSNNHDDAKDLFQEVLLNIWKSLPSFKDNSNISTWVYRISLNICLRAKTKDNKKNELIQNIDGVILQNFEESFDSENSNKISSLYKCLKKLDKSDKSIILLYLEDLPYKDISEITGLSENHIAVKMKRIKSKLFTCINKQEL